MKRWWNKPIPERYFGRDYRLVLAIVVAIIVTIILDPIARWWFASLIVGSVLVAILLHMSRRDGGL